MRTTFGISLFAAIAALVGAPAAAQSQYLNESNITVEVGAGTSPGSFNNTFANGASIVKVIDADSAAATEFHDQSTHIWFTAAQPGGGLELRFDFQTEYDLATLHFWNYTAEGFDVDNIAFTFFDGLNQQVGTLSIAPALGTSPGITAQDIGLAAPLNVRYVTAFLTGSNQQVDFQNIGFTATASTPTTPTTPIPEPSTYGLMMFGLAAVAAAARRRRR
jgi:ABC-type amino acid transport substrate-binding protein